MAPTLREIKKERTRTAIVDAALALFSEHGYDAVTVGEIARAAEVGERTLYRYFADKEEILFGEDDDARGTLADVLVSAPPDTAPLDLLRRGIEAVAEVLGPRRELLGRRAAVIAATPALRGRELTKQAGYQQVIVAELARRGVGVARARLIAAVGVACAVESLARWLSRPDHGSLTAELEAVVAEVRTLDRAH